MEGKYNHTEALLDVMGYFRYRGRIVEKVSDGYVMGGIKFKSLIEIDVAIDEILEKWNESIVKDKN